MSTKAKANSKTTPKSAPKGTGSKNASMKETKTLSKQAALVSETPVVTNTNEEGDEMDADELEASNSSSSGGGAEAALAALTASTEATGSLKNFRHHPDMENFYRFIYENDLRIEAVKIIDEMMLQRENQKAIKVAKTKTH